MPKQVFDKKDWYFTGGVTKFTKLERSYLRMDDTGLFSTTNAKDAQRISELISNLPGLSKNDLKGRKPVITDGCACCGGNSISFVFCGEFAKVNALELKEICFKILKHNLDTCEKLRSTNSEIQLIQGSYLDFMSVLCQDVVFIDPPWGGVDYKKQKELSLFLSGMHIADIVITLHKNSSKTGTKYIVIKTCQNFALDEMQQKIKACDPNLKVSLLLQTSKYPVYYISFIHEN